MIIIKNTFVKLVLVIFGFLCIQFTLFSQNTSENFTADSLNLQLKDSIQVVDTLIVSVKDSTEKKKGKFQNPVIANAGDSLVVFQKENRIIIYKSGELIYEDINLKADYIELDLNTNLVYAMGLEDSSGTIVGKPQFTEGKESYEMTSMYYNFDSKKAIINGVITEQGGGYLVGERTKKMPDNTFNIRGGKFTTCDDHEHPHFYIQLTKSKTIPNDKTISGPAFLVIQDIPLPLGLPFGFFPATQKQTSGFLVPRFGEDNIRGFFLQNGGYYWAMSEYADVSLTGSYYTKGSWDATFNSSYKWKYKFSGNLSATYLYVKNDDVALTGSPTFKITWRHTQDAKAHPTRTFSANVNFQMAGFDLAERNLAANANNRKTSTISYSKQFAGTPFSLTATMSQSSNTIDESIELNLPQVSLSMRQIYPFKRKNKVGETKWYEKIGVSYSGSLKNSISTSEEDLFTAGGTYGQWRNGLKHSIPVSTSFNIFKYLQVGPSFNFTDYMYFKGQNFVLNSDSSEYVTDTLSGFQNAYEYSLSVGVSTTAYGMYTFKEGMPIQAIRHKLNPSISLSYRPDFSDIEKFNFYQLDPSDSTNNSYFTSALNPFLGYPGSGKSGNIGFSLRNNIEMKVRSKKDTVAGFEKIKLLDALNFSGSYNLLADSLNLSNISMSANTRIKNFINLNFSASFDPYAFNPETSKTNKRINKFEIIENRNLARLTRASVSLDFSLKSVFGGEGEAFTDNYVNDLNSPYSLYHGNMYIEQYVDFSVPWDLKVRYNFSYSKPYEEKTITQSVTVSGNFSLTDNWKIGFSSGYDLAGLDFTQTSFNIYRDLHCWEMSFGWTPIGPAKFYNFKINIKSSILQDLKYEKQEYNY